MDRYTFGFTLRDSPDFFINISVWGSEGYVAALSGSISVGDCGKELSQLTCKRLRSEI